MTTEGNTTLSQFGGGSPDSADETVEEARHVTQGDEVAELVDLSDHRFPDADGNVELAVTQVDYTVEGVGDEEYPVLHVFGRTADRTAEHVRVFDFQPYFYTPVDDLDHEAPDDRPIRESDFVDDRLMEERITGVQTRGDREPSLDEPEAEEVVTYESIRSEELVRVFGQTPRDVGQLRDRFDHFEADILFPNRLLIDKDITSGVRVPAQRADDGTLKVHHEQLTAVDLDVEPRVHTFDIEVDDRSGFPEDGEETVICMTSHDSYRDEYVAWLYDAPDATVDAPETLEGFEFWNPDGDATVDLRTFDTEEAMHEDYVDYLTETDPDVLTGWNFDDFDAPYYVARLEELGLDSDRLSRVDEVWDSGWGGPDIKGRVVFDLLYAYERRQYSELDSYRLDAVAEQELGAGKERYTGDIGDLWEQDPERLLEYNLRDVELCVEIDRKVDLISFWNEVASFVGCKLEDATTPGDAVDLYVLHKVHGDFALPSKGSVDAEEYEGGAVFDPISGIRENVTVLDLKCFSGDTDLLTPEGVRNIRNIETGDPVYTLNPETFECEVKPVAETHTYENQFGELHHLSGNTHDLKVTENHRFLYSKERGWDDQTPDDFAFDEYRDIPENERFAFPQHEPMAGSRPERFDLADEVEDGHAVVYSDTDLRAFRNQMPEAVIDALDLAHGSSQALAIQKPVGKYLLPIDTYRAHRDVIDEHADDVFLTHGRQHSEIPRSFEMDDWLRLLGWYVTEGSVDSANERITLHQQDVENRAALRDLLDGMGIRYNADDRGLNVSNRMVAGWLAEHCGEGYAEKQLPDWVFGLDASLLSTLLDTLIRGDGSVTESGLRKFWTKSPHLRDAVAEIAVRCGHKPTVSEQSDGTYYVSIGKRGSFHKGTNATVEDHDGQVHCITAADNHVVLAGRNGNFQWVGQSLYPMCMVTTNASPETKVNPDEYDGETYRAPNGTHFRKEPDGIIREMVDELLTERENKKAARDEHDPGSTAYQRYDSQQAAVKVIMNSLYGVLGWDRFRLYDKEMGAAVTATGREVIEFTEQAANEIDYDVAYGDSVTGDRPVTVRDPGGRVRVLPIETLFGLSSSEPDSELLIAVDGGTARSVPAGKERGRLDGWEALSMNTDGNAEWQPIREVVRHEIDEPVVTLQHKFGESTTTRDHSYVIKDGDELAEAKPEEIDEPLRIQGMPEVDPIETVDVYDVLDGYTRRYEDGRCVGSENAQTKTKRICADDEYVWFGHEHHGRLDSTVKIQRHIDLESETGAALVRLLAAYVTEGSASTIETADSRFGASIAESSREWLERLQNDYHLLFESTDASIIESDTNDARTAEYETVAGTGRTTYNDTTKKLQMMNELAAVFFREFAGQTSRGKRIPSFVFHLSERLQSLFLDVLIEGDGSREFPRYSEAYAERNFDFETTSRELAAGLSMLLIQRDEKYSLKYRDDKESYTIRTCDYYREGRSPVVTERSHAGYVYDLSVAENENFVDAVGGVVLHNTDSVMLELGNEYSKEEAIDASFEIEEHINDSYDDFALERLNAEFHRFQIEFEKLYRRFFQAGKKKRYAGHIVWKEGKDVDDVDITGFEYKRSDIAPVTKEVQKTVLEMIVKDGDVEGVKEYVHDVIEEFQRGERPLDDIGIPGGIGKKLDAYDTDTAQVRGSKYANLLLGTNIQRGSKPKRLYLEKVHPDFWERVEAERGLDPQSDPLYGEFKRDPDVICFEYADEVPDEFQVDWDKMLEKTLRGPIARILEALDVSWEEVRDGQEQTGLSSFM